MQADDTNWLISQYKDKTRFTLRPAASRGAGRYGFPFHDCIEVCSERCVLALCTTAQELTEVLDLLKDA